MKYDYHKTPLGAMLLSSPDGVNLSGVWFTRKQRDTPETHGWERDRKSRVLTQTKRELDAYFAGHLKRFSVPIVFVTGTDFQKAVWKALLRIRYGKIATYRDMAVAILRPMSARPVGGAVGSNPISIIVPCHRVIGTNGSLTGYGGGMDRKIHLLDLEGAEYCK